MSVDEHSNAGVDKFFGGFCFAFACNEASLTKGLHSSLMFRSLIYFDHLGGCDDALPRLWRVIPGSPAFGNLDRGFTQKGLQTILATNQKISTGPRLSL